MRRPGLLAFPAEGSFYEGYPLAHPAEGSAIRHLGRKLVTDAGLVGLEYRHAFSFGLVIARTGVREGFLRE